MKGLKCGYAKPPEIHFCQEDTAWPDCHHCEIYKERMKPKVIPSQWQKPEQDDDGGE